MISTSLKIALAELLRLSGQATPGEWDSYWRLREDRDGGHEADCGVTVLSGSKKGYAVSRCPRYQTKEQWDADGSYIAFSRNFVEAHRDELEKLMGEKS